ncbi:RNA polymerase sigma factor (sigma-70 family) [Streptomyces sp. Ag109_O5-1]|uniref:sigma-70 family RNA polymerase sigma factor n=1 Tax=Streptomyces sp. Ag109_O5-1 TaxID=1938851 RepID=UPI000F4F0568|nr:sigma-70 family RNA polymerase sigma factor [Streptomyces sp. Ag109_O5-1]RPE42205.1 RNA polymerase sigma factor (sigma-70 family) [Streptomyces sp. Ag109_O5-1]
MPRHAAPAADVIAAARAGDRGALEELSSRTLPLVYSVAARAHPYRDDVDDVVQETMMRILRGIGGLERPEAFRSWVITITVNEVRDHIRRRGRRETTGAAFDAAEHRPDPAADFAEGVILDLRLSGQREESVRATRWLDEDDRELLSLWWLETAGRLARPELASALDMTGHQAAVRVQRMKERLHTSRVIVRALAARPACGELTRLTLDWNGAPSGLWRKRLSRHVRQCPRCVRHEEGMLAPEGLLASLALLPVPVALLAWRPWLSAGTHAAAAGQAGTTVTSGSGGSATAGTAGTAGTSLTAKAVVAASALLAVGGGVLVYAAPWSSPSARPATAAPTASGPAPAPSLTASASASPSRPAPVLGSAVSRPSPRPRYGSVVDIVDSAPPADRPPAALPHRPQTTVTMTGLKSHLDGYQLVHRGDTVVLRGKGYFTVHWDVMYGLRPGLLTMPSWTGLRGRLFHVASGGGHRMDDRQPGATAGGTWMGNRQQGLIILPPGAQQMWQNEYYYLDGSVTLHLNETQADYNLDVLPSSWQETADDIASPPAPHSADRERYGLVRDTGRDDAPVPQYTTRSTPTEAGTVPQRSVVS